MANLLEIVERAGVQVEIWDNGLERNAVTKKIMKPPPHTIITPERHTLLHQRRLEKTAALLRRRIVETHNGAMPSQVTTSAEAFAEAGAMLHEQVVLNSDAYPRDRMEAWEKLGKYAQVLPADVKQAAAEQPLPAGAVGSALGTEAREFFKEFFADVLHGQPERDVIDGSVAADE